MPDQAAAKLDQAFAGSKPQATWPSPRDVRRVETSNWAICDTTNFHQMVVKSMGHPRRFQGVRRLVKYDNLARLYGFFSGKKIPRAQLTLELSTV